MSAVEEEREILAAELLAAAAEQSPNLSPGRKKGKKILKREEKLLTQFRVKISLYFFKPKLPARRVNELIDFNKRVMVQGVCAADGGV